jgi:hypothetical protein
MCSSNQANSSGRSHHKNVLHKILVGHSNPKHHSKILLQVSLQNFGKDLQYSNLACQIFIKLGPPQQNYREIWTKNMQ